MWVKKRSITNPAGYLFTVTHSAAGCKGDHGVSGKSSVGHASQLIVFLIKQRFHEEVVDCIQLLVGIKSGQQILPILVNDL